MTQAQVKLASFEEYLAYSEALSLAGRYELIAGELVQLPPESRLNSTLAVRVLLALLAAGVALEFIHPGKCELQVPVLRPGDAANRYPDLVVLRPEHLALTQRRLTITRDMPPPRLVVEVVSPGKANQERDYLHKRDQYAAIAVPEYWLIDPATATVLVLTLGADGYEPVEEFAQGAAIASLEFPALTLPVAQLFEGETP